MVVTPQASTCKQLIHYLTRVVGLVFLLLSVEGGNLSPDSHCIYALRACCGAIAIPIGVSMTTDQLKLFYAILETKNSWGKNEIRTVLLEVVSGIRTAV